MSQTPESTVPDKTFLEQHAEGYKELRASGLRGGPIYRESESSPLVWYDQVFAREITPSGSVSATEPLLVGATQNGLDVILVASHANAGKLSVPSGATITLKTLVADSPDGTFQAIGPSYCVEAPTEGISADPDELVARFPIGNFKKQWLKITLVFTGSITGGKIDAALSYVAR